MDPSARSLLTTLILVPAVLSCSSPSGPRPLPTLLVTNPTCAAGQCRTVEVRIFDWNLTIPQPFWGYKIMGEVDGQTACLTFPAPWTFFIYGPDSTGKVDTTVFKLNVNDAIFLAAMDSARFHTDSIAPLSTIVGHTTTFTAADAPGWQVAFSGDTVTTSPTEAAACK
jgi:hypothetical protein